jgi:hypothetical protein
MHIVTRSDESPIRRYARDAVAAVTADALIGVLQWRIATMAADRLRQYLRLPLLPLELVPTEERELYLQIAANTLALVESIDGDAPPTAGEIRRYERRRQLLLTRARVRCDAVRLRHELLDFQPSESGYELARCRWCHAGVSIHLGTAAASASAGFEALCPSG